MREVPLVAGRRERRHDALDELGRHFVDEPRRLARLVVAEDPPPRRAGEHEPLTRPRHPDVTEATLLLELLLVLARAGMGEESLFEAGEDHHRELETLGAVQGHQPDARIAIALLLVHIGQQRQAVDEAAQRRLRLAAFVLARRRDELREVLDARLRVFAAILAQIVQVSASIERLADRDGDRILPRDLGERDEQIAKHGQRRRRPAGEGAVLQPTNKTGPQ